MKLSNKGNKKTISFFSHDLNKEKFIEIKNLAIKIRNYKNKVSEHYYKFYHNQRQISCIDFINDMKIYRPLDISASFFQQICKEVYELYNKKRKNTKKQIIFTKLTFTGINSITKPMFEESNNKYTNGIINFNIPKQDKIAIPFRYSKKYHGKLEDIHYSFTGKNKKQYQKQYECSILRNKIKINIAIDDNSQQQINTCNHIEGVDVNVKHNLLQCSDGFSVDYDRKLIKKIIKNYQRNDKIASTKAKRNLSTNFGNKQINRMNKNQRRSKAMIEQCIVKLLKHCKENNIDHLVFEDLNQFTGKCFSKSKDFNDINYRNLMKALRLVDIKNIVQRIAKKYGITISLTFSEYTSRTCNKCGHISSENRRSQEHFHCIKCGHEDNADLNAAKNIRDRISVNVLRNLLHEEIEPNKWQHINLKHKEIYESLAYLSYVS